MQLQEFMKLRGLDDEAVAARINKSRVSVSRYRRGKEPIPSQVVKALVEFSEGQITANELLGISEAAE